MQFGMNSLNEIAQKVLDKELKYKDTVIIGDNASGKSFLLKLMIEKKKSSDDIYFIDAVNRGFDVSKIIKNSQLAEYKNTVINRRIQEEYFNLKDSFDCYGTLTERIEQIYAPLEKDLQDLFEKLTAECFQIVPESILGKVEFKKGTGLLSSGYQAIVRILMELLYYQNGMDTRQLVRTMVVIDELDEFLSPGYAYKILPFIKRNFSKMEFVVSTHSCDLVVGAQDANLIVLHDRGYEVMETNDFQSISEVQIVFDRVFGRHSKQVPEVEDILRRLFNNKLNNVWTELDQCQLEGLQKEDMTASQQLIFRQIMEW